MHTLQERFIDKVVKVAKDMKVAKYVNRKGDVVSPYHQRLVDMRSKYERKMNHPHCTNNRHDCGNKRKG